MKKIIFLLVIAIFTASCSHYSPQYSTARKIHGKKGSLPKGQNYRVQKGDTLFGIAWKHGVTVEELVRWNNLPSQNSIRVGQVLRTSATSPYPKTYATRTYADTMRANPPTSTAKPANTQPAVTANLPAVSGWSWPTRGKIIQTYNGNIPSRQGIRIAGTRGQAVLATANGRVTYVGADVKFIGRMVMIEHAGGLISIYGFLENNILVKEGQTVKRGQKTATMGIGQQNTPSLNFEIHRSGGKSVNPLSYIGSNAN